MTADMRTLLLVEDDYESQRYLEVLLKHSYQLFYAESANEGWDIVSERAVDLVLMDISLRGPRDGLDLTRQLRGDPRYANTPIIAVTAHAFPQDRIECMQAGCDAYFSKPFNQNSLLNRIQDLLLPAS